MRKDETPDKIRVNCCICHLNNVPLLKKKNDFE